MSTEATAEALAVDTAMPEAEETVSQEVSDDDALAAIWDKADQPEEPKEEPKAEEGADEKAADDAGEGEEAPDQAEDAEDSVEPPSELPRGVKEHWKDIPESAREAILESQRGLSRKLSEQGRLIEGISPIRDALTDAIQKRPELANMRPQDMARDVMQLAEVSANFQSRPVETMLGLIQQHGLQDAMRQALSGQQPTQDSQRENQLLQKISGLERKVQELTDPNFLQQQFSQYDGRKSATSAVEDFASKADHWSDVEAEMPRFIAAVKQISPDASPQDVLSDAYDLAVKKLVPEAKATPQPAAQEAAKTVDPEKTEAARKAKSVNVRDTASGKFRSMTEEEELAAVYARMQD